jgi:hypothetical protein
MQQKGRSSDSKLGNIRQNIPVSVLESTTTQPASSHMISCVTIEGKSQLFCLHVCFYFAHAQQVIVKLCRCTKYEVFPCIRAGNKLQHMHVHTSAAAGETTGLLTRGSWSGFAIARRAASISSFSMLTTWLACAPCACHLKSTVRTESAWSCLFNINLPSSSHCQNFTWAASHDT